MNTVDIIPCFNVLKYRKFSFFERRVLKIILEQVCKINLIGTPNFSEEIAQNLKEYDRIIEELLYVGYWSIGLADYIATSQLFPDSVGIQIENGDLEILKYPPYHQFIDFYLHDLSDHDGDVVIQNTIIGLKSLLHDDLGLDYDNLTAIIPRDFNDSHNRYAIIRLLLNGLPTK